MKYKIIYADPPWQYQDKGCNGNCADHYKTMSIDELKQLPIKDLADNDSVLFLWTTYPMLKEALELIDSWGFKYKSIAFQWVKTTSNGKYFYGLGRWTRGNTEPCLLATRGKPQRVSKAVSQLVLSPIRDHSRKPDEIRTKIVELMGNLPRVELFARTRFDGWDCYGDELSDTIQKSIM